MSAAGTSRQALAFWPDHSGEKSPRPARSAAARSGAIAAVASGNAGARVAQRPELAHDAVDDAARGPAGEEVGQRGVARARAACSAARCSGAGGGLGAQQVGGADLHAAAPSAIAAATPRRIGDAAGRDHRHLDSRGHDLRQQRERADLRRRGRRVRNMPRWPPASRPCAMMASAPCASSQRASSTVVADDSTLAPQPSRARAARRDGRPKWKLTTARPERPRARRPCASSNGCAPGAGAGRSPGRCRTPGSTARARRASRPRARRRASGGVWQKKLTLNGACGAAPRSAASSARSASGASIAQGSEPSPPALATAIASALALHARHRRLDERQLRCRAVGRVRKSSSQAKAVACGAAPAICRSARSNTSTGWPPEIRCWSLMMIAGTEWMPASV